MRQVRNLEHRRTWAGCFSFTACFYYVNFLVSFSALHHQRIVNPVLEGVGAKKRTKTRKMIRVGLWCSFEGLLF